MLPARFDHIRSPPIRGLLGVVLGSVAFGTGFVRYAQLVDGSGPLLDVLSVYGLWSLGAVLVVVAALPTALGYSGWYSFAVPFGLLFGAVSVIGIAYTGQPPSNLEKFGYGLLFGSGSALVLGTLAAVLGISLRRAVSRLGRRTWRLTSPD
jgi:hypothetical protein